MSSSKGKLEDGDTSIENDEKRQTTGESTSSSSGAHGSTRNDLEKEIEQTKEAIEKQAVQLYMSKCLLKVQEFELKNKNADNGKTIDEIKEELSKPNTYVSALNAMDHCVQSMKENIFAKNQWLALKNTFEIEYTELKICHENKEIARYGCSNEYNTCIVEMGECKIAVLKVKLEYLKQKKEFPKCQGNDHDNIFVFLYGQLNSKSYDEAIEAIISGVSEIKGTGQAGYFSSAIKTFNEAEKILLENLIVKLGTESAAKRNQIKVQLLKCQIEVCELQLFYVENGNDDIWKKYCLDMYWGLEECQHDSLKSIFEKINSYIKSMRDSTRNNSDWNECKEVFKKARDALKNLQIAQKASELLGICRRALRSELKNSEALSENRYKRIRNKLYMIEDNINDGEDLQTIIDDVASCTKKLPNHSEIKEVFRDAYKELIVLKNEQEDLLDKLHGF